jgi:hypothetical protein
MHDVQTRMRLELLPSRTRTFWMLGSHRRLERLWEKLTCFPNHGSLSQISHRYDMFGRPPEETWEASSLSDTTILDLGPAIMVP